MKNSEHLGYLKLLYQIIGKCDFTKNINDKSVSTNYPKNKKHWWVGLKKKPHYYKYYGKLEGGDVSE